jgi:hypothetical protein
MVKRAERRKFSDLILIILLELLNLRLWPDCVHFPLGPLVFDKSSSESVSA